MHITLFFLGFPFIICISLVTMKTRISNRFFPVVRLCRFAVFIKFFLLHDSFLCFSISSFFSAASSFNKSNIQASGRGQACRPALKTHDEEWDRLLVRSIVYRYLTQRKFSRVVSSHFFLILILLISIGTIRAPWQTALEL